MVSFVNNFVGTAWFYARYRPGYPTALSDLLEAEASLDRDCSVLDLGCGTGEIGLALAPIVGRLVGVDPDADMLTEADLKARRRGIGNVTWVQTTAESFDAEAGSVRLVTIGSALHWMDGPQVVANCYRLLAPGGLLAVVSGPNPLAQIAARDRVGTAIAEVQSRWFGTPTPAPHAQKALPVQTIAAS
ncbi:MAG: class I SAM-dependent methyltransferase, partial [Actinobacteria bacterium]|nr:class I SAM-dependent methyltransferase [Actinomycetota bacterium]